MGGPTLCVQTCSTAWRHKSSTQPMLCFCCNLPIFDRLGDGCNYQDIEFQGSIIFGFAVGISSIRNGRMTRPELKEVIKRGIQSTYQLLASAIMLALMGCTGFQVQGDIQAGREALMMGRPWWALNRFQRAAQLDPHYVTDFTVFEEGVWTYIGRAHYQLGELEQARKALKRAREEHNGDHLAHIYLGLVLIRQGESERGVREAAVGLRSLQAWLRDLDRYDSAGQYWDYADSGRFHYVLARVQHLNSVVDLT